MNIRSTKDLADAIRGRRLDLGMTQIQLAATAGVSRKWISEIEGGKPTAEVRLVLRVLDALELRIEVLNEQSRPPTKRIGATDTGVEKSAQVRLGVDEIKSLQESINALQGIDRTALTAFRDTINATQLEIDPGIRKSLQESINALQGIDQTALTAFRNALGATQLEIDPGDASALLNRYKALSAPRPHIAGTGPDSKGSADDDE